VTGSSFSKSAGTEIVPFWSSASSQLPLSFSSTTIIVDPYRSIASKHHKGLYNRPGGMSIVTENPASALSFGAANNRSVSFCASSYARTLVTDETSAITPEMAPIPKNEGVREIGIVYFLTAICSVETE
jgi:hypothetical protein